MKHFNALPSLMQSIKQKSESKDTSGGTSDTPFFSPNSLDSVSLKSVMNPGPANPKKMPLRKCSEAGNSLPAIGPQ